MSQQQRVIFIRLPEVKRRRGKGKTAVHDDVKTGLLPPPVKIGIRASGWIEHEVDAVNAALAAGKSTPEIKALVAELCAARSTTRGYP